MLLTFQQPLGDVRPFLADDAGRLARPRWLNPSYDAEFVRGVGAVRRRLRGGVSPWPGEGWYCDATKLVRSKRFNELGNEAEVPTHPALRSFQVVFRRFLSNGEALSRYELGLANAAPREAIKPQVLASLVFAMRELPVRVPLSDAPDLERPLSTVGRALSEAVLAATTRIGAPIQAAWLAPGAPLLLVEYQTREITGIPNFSLALRGFELPEGMQLSYDILDGLRVWCVGALPGVSRQDLRRMRVHLLRLHAERESLGVVLDALADGLLCTDEGLPAFHRLESYLQNRIGFLKRQDVYGHDQPLMLRMAFGAEDLVEEGKRESLLEHLRQAREATRMAVAEVTHPDEDRIFRLGGS